MDEQPFLVESIIQRLLEVRGSRPGTNAHLTESEIRGLCLKSRQIFLEQPMLLDLGAPLKVVGDIHGQYYDLLRLFEYGGFPPESNYLFLGNYVDLGKQSLETICLLLAYKIKYPENFFLLRGNHECASINRIHGFFYECKRRYNIRVWKTFTDCFNCLPVAAIIDEKIFCCHGGLSPDLQSMEQIRRIIRPIDVPDQGLMCDLLWAKPDKESLGWGADDSGMSFTFGTEIVSKFLTKHDLDLICRGNQVVEDGYEFFAKRQLVTLFSAPNFTGEYDNAGAIMSVDKSRMCSFQILKPQDKKAKFWGVSSPPIGLKADSIKSASITISWQPPHDVNGIIRGYQVSYTPHGETECLLDVVGDTTSTELTSLKPHTKYTICVRAKTVDFGDYCTPITVNTHEDVWRCPITAEELNTWNEERLRLLSVEIESRRAQQIEYIGSRCCSVCKQEFGLIFKRGVQCPICLNKICNNCRITPRDPPPAFMCEVCAKKRVLDLHLSRPTTQKPTMEQAALKETKFPSPPIGLKADSIKPTSITISWQPPHDVNGIIRGYQVSYTPHGETECLHDVVGDTTSTELTSLKPHTKYTICVRAKTEDFGDYCTPITVDTPEDELFTKKLSSILENYKDITFKELRIIKLLFYGTPRAGKTTLRKNLLQNIDTLQQSSGIFQPSTNLAEMCDPIFVERIVLTNEESNTWRWTVQKLDDIAKTLLQCLDNKLLQFENENVDLEDAPLYENRIESLTPGSLVTENHPYLDNDKEQSADTPGIYNEPTLIRKENISDSLPPSLPTGTVAVDVKRLFFEAVKTGQWAEVMSTLNIDKAMLVQVIDGGGQPSFQEIFPLLISGPSVTLLIFKLTDDLQISYPVQYQPSVGEECTWHDTYVVRDFIFHAISSVVPITDNTKNQCKMLLVGTHKDELEGFEHQKKGKITSIAKSLHSWLHELKAFKSIHVRNIEEFIIGIDNFKHEDLLKVKKKIEELLSQAAPRDIPAPWLIFDYVLHAYAKSEKIRKVEKIKSKEIAKLCGVKDDEFEVVLHYLHYEAGTLLYYSDIPELNNWVITDFQLIFDSISQVIIDYFNYCGSEFGPHMHHKDLLHEKGQLEASVLKDVEGCLKVNELLSLMQHRHIISKMDGNTFFMPSVLPKAAPSYNKISSNSCSFIVMFESGCCPIGLFCAATTRLIVMQKWILNRGDLQFRNRISFYCSCYGKSYQVIFSAFFAHYEVCLMGNEVKSNVKFAVYKALDIVLTKVCKDMNYPPPSYGFYCPKTCRYSDVTYLQNEHPAKCTFDMEAQEMTCYYSDAPSDLKKEHKSWFVQVQPQDQISERTPEVKDLMNEIASVIPAKWRDVGIQLGVSPGTLDGIQSQNAGKPPISALQHSFERVFVEWKQLAQCPYTWKTIIDVLTTPAVAENELAIILAAKYL